MDAEHFPTESYLDAAVRLLKVIKYYDTNYTYEKRLRNLKYVYSKAALHFAQPKQQSLITASSARLQFQLQSIAPMIIYAWARVNPEVMADLTIHYTYALLLDDSENDPEPKTKFFCQDLLAGRSQRDPWWQMVNDELPTLLGHYGPYCGLKLLEVL